jgi:putative MATE family efflux protein
MTSASDAPLPQATIAPHSLEAESFAPANSEQTPASRSTVNRFDRSLIEGPLLPAVWRIAWPTMLHNVVGGLQGVVDHAMVGHYVGFEGNAAIGVSWQIFLVVVVFVSSLFTGMAVLVSRYVGAGDCDRVNHTIYQAFLTALFLSLAVLAPIGFFAAPYLLEMVNATEPVQALALPYLRIMFVFSWGMLLYFMLGGALRSAGDAATPLRIGVIVTLLNVVLNAILIPGFGPIPALGTAGSALGTVIATCGAGVYAMIALKRNVWVVGFPVGGSLKPDFKVIRELFRFGLPAGLQGIAMNVGGVFLLAFVGSLSLSAQAQAAYTVGYTQIFSLITWTTIGLMSAAATIAGQSVGAGKPDRAEAAVHSAARIAVGTAGVIGLVFLVAPRMLLSVFGMDDPATIELAVELLRYLSISGIFIALALTYTGGLQGTGDTRSPLYISIVSQVVLPLGICFTIQQMGTLEAHHIWVSILVGHVTRCILSVAMFRRGGWRNIKIEA